MALLKPYKEYMLENDITLTEGSAASVISKAKAKGKTAAVVFKDTEEEERSARRLHKPGDPPFKPGKTIDRILAEVYIGYEQVLKQNNALDFDDLLIYGVKLFGGHEESVLWCQHILVDELYVPTSLGGSVLLMTGRFSQSRHKYDAIRTHEIYWNTTPCHHCWRS